MVAKQLLFQDEARQRILRGIDTLARAVCVTLGPRGRTVILERDFGPPQIVNSGVLVAKSVELEDRFENMGAQLLREVAARTSELAGDGTTTATVLAHAMITEGMRLPARVPIRGRSRTWRRSRQTTTARSATCWPAHWTRWVAMAR